MHSDFILDPIKNLLIRHTAFAYNRMSSQDLRVSSQVLSPELTGIEKNGRARVR